MVTEKIGKLMSAYKSTLKKIEGGHSFAIIEYDHQENINALPEIIEGANGSPFYESSISWLDLQMVQETYQTKGVWRAISIEMTPLLIVERMQEAWSFQKMFNASKWRECSGIELEMSSIIAKMEEALEMLENDLTACQEMYLDLGGNDCWIIIISSVKGIQAFEFLHWID